MTPARRSTCSTARWTPRRRQAATAAWLKHGQCGLAHHANGDATSATADLAAALTHAVPAGYCRLFLDEGQPMAMLLAQCVHASPADVRTHAEQLLSAVQRPTAPRLLDPSAMTS